MLCLLGSVLWCFLQDASSIRVLDLLDRPPGEQARLRSERRSAFLSSLAEQRPDGWREMKEGSVQVLLHGNTRYARDMSKHFDQILGWWDRRFPAVGPEAYVRPLLLLLGEDKGQVTEVGERLHLHPRFDGAFLTHDVPRQGSSKGGASGRFISYASETSEESERNRAAVEISEYWWLERDRRLYWSLPKSISACLLSVIRAYEVEGGKLVLHDHWNYDSKSLLERGIPSLKGAWRTAEWDPGLDHLSRKWLLFFLDGPGARKSAWKEVLPRYLRAARDIVSAEEHGFRFEMPRTPPEEILVLEEEQRFFEGLRPRVAVEAFDATFADWTEKDFEQLQRAFLEWLES